MKPIIEIHHLSKKYILGERQPYLSLRDNLTNLLTQDVRQRREEFWALRDINLSVSAGEVVGIIGKNGAGKSTLLKILSRITPPTQGSIVLRGRIVSLLEVGTGFHPELTGRDNIFLNGSILGMTRKEIKSKFDQIVDFAEIEKFIDTPVKRYSSGMYMRLAFAVASHLDPEILVIDEVLSVGDTHFQKKSLGKMDEVSKQGRTIIFVSHNLEAVKRLCTRVVLLDSGEITNIGSPDTVISKYIKDNLYNVTRKTHLFPLIADNSTLKVLDFSLKGAKAGEPISWESSVEFNKLPSQFNYVIALENEAGQRIVSCTSHPSIAPKAINKIGKYHFKGALDTAFLMPGVYRCALGVRFNDQTVIYQPEVGYIKLIDSDKFPGQNGLIYTNTNWEVEYVR